MKANQFYREFFTTGTGERRVHNVHTAFKTSTNHVFSFVTYSDPRIRASTTSRTC